MNVQFAVAKEGQMLWTCGYGISPDIDPENLDAAYALLNWYTSLPPQIYAADELELPDVERGHPRRGARRRSSRKPRSTRCSSSENAIPASPPDDRAAWVAAWTEVKASLVATRAVERPGARASPDVAGAARWRRRRAVNAWGWRAFLTVVGLMLFGPLLILVLFSFNDSNVLAFPLEGVTTKWYARGAVATRRFASALSTRSRSRSSWRRSAWCSARWLRSGSRGSASGVAGWWVGSSARR